MSAFAARRILRAIGTVGLLTGVAYTASILRDAILAALYGRSSALDIYFIALAPSQFLGMEMASLAYLAFLPEFSHSLGTGSAKGADELLRERLALTVKGTLSVAILVTIAGSLFARVLAPGYAQVNTLPSVRLSIAGLSLLIPIVGLIGVFRAFLEAQGRFVPWALVPAFRSGVLSVVVLLSALTPSIGWLIAGSLMGAATALACSWVTAHALPSYRTARQGHATGGRSPLPRSLVPLMAALVVGEATVLVDNAFASRTGVGGVQAFTLASNLLVIPQALITGAVATVYFPVYGAHFASGDRVEALKSLRGSVRLVVWSALPVVLVFCTGLGSILARVIYHRGTFDLEMVSLVSQAAAGLSLGLAPYASMMLMRQYVLVAGGPWLVFQAAGIFLCVKWLGNLALTNSLGILGIALSSSLAAVMACSYLALRVRRLAHTHVL